MKELKFTVSSRDGIERIVVTSSDILVSRLANELAESLPFSDGDVNISPSSFRLTRITSNETFNETLEPSKTLKQNDVKNGDYLLLWAVYPRYTHLLLERERLEKLARENDWFSFTAYDLERLTFQFHTRSIIGITNTAEPVYGEEHAVSVFLDDLFPEEIPILLWKTPIWHPAIDHHEPKHVAISSWWSPGQGLDALAKLFLNMLQYKIYHAEWTPPYPLDVEVARWVKDYAEPNRLIDKSRGLLTATNVDAAATANSRKATTDFKENKLILFISHSSKDAGLVELLVDLLTNALALNPYEIRCTSVDGYRLPIGAKTDEYLRKEIQEAKLFIGVISTSSIRSTYVLFELGARWGCGKHLAPLLASTSIPNMLFGPLANLNALRCDNASQLHQLIHDMADELKITPRTPADNQRYIEKIINYAKTQAAT